MQFFVFGWNRMDILPTKFSVLGHPFSHALVRENRLSWSLYCVCLFVVLSGSLL